MEQLDALLPGYVEAACGTGVSTLTDLDFDTARRQLDREISRRAECETNALRLFYSSLTYNDLQIARRETYGC